MDRRLPRSPVLSPKSPAIYEKYKSGCAWGLIHFFNSHGNLISDEKCTNRQAKGDGYKRNKPSLLPNEEKIQYIDNCSMGHQLEAHYIERAQSLELMWRVGLVSYITAGYSKM
ncbi:hypothetical protein V6N13_102306 [Hibiscus sabdariffa]|uniref:Uncharacterized protein n=1 Tax=Hibiscus sabdariffa TaxID=183260 RepID=A0ABR2D3M3_9ROSI